MPPLILTDSDLESVDMTDATSCMEEAFRQHALGKVIAPARIISDLKAAQLVFTVGASTTDPPFAGFRVYDLNQIQSTHRSELTVVLDATDGSMRGLVIGPKLGAIRTGAIGGVAIKHLARDDARSLGLIGSGYQAHTQLEAAAAVRDFTSVRVYSRDPQRCVSFANTMSHKLDRKIEAVEKAQSVVENCDVLICATTSPTPVIDAAWLKPGVHINTIGPKFKDRSELGMDVFERASRLVTDSPAQAQAFGDTYVLHGTPMTDSVEDLSSIVAANAAQSQRKADRITLFVSLGLAGTEVVLANRLFDSVQIT